MNPEYNRTVFRTDSPPNEWPSRFAVVTACNPDGIRHSGEDNARFDAWLLVALEAEKIKHWRVTGTSADFQHSEPGYAIETNLENALNIANKFRQEAIFWIEHGHVSVISCTTREKVLLGAWPSRLIPPGPAQDEGD